MDDIASLDGYDGLRQFVIDALRKREGDEATWMFETDETIDIGDLFKSNHSSNSKEKSPQEKALALLQGGVFDVEEGFNDMASDYMHSQDTEWFEKERDSVMHTEAKAAIGAFALRHGVDVDDVEEALKNDSELEFGEVFEYGLHYCSYNYIGSVPVQVALEATLSTEPTDAMASTLSLLRIRPQDWIDAVAADVNDNPDNASDYMRRQAEFDLGTFTSELMQCVARASEKGQVFAQDPEEALVPAKGLLDKMVHTWNQTQCELMLRFNLDSDHIDAVSRPLARHLESHEMITAGVLLHGPELLPHESQDPGKGEGIDLKKPFFCRLGDIKLAGRESDPRDPISTQIAGTLGLNFAVYEEFLKAEEKEGRNNRVLLDRAQGRKMDGPQDFVPEPLRTQLAKIFSKADGFDVERLRERYSGIRDLMPSRDLLAGTPKDWGKELIDLLRPAAFDVSNWSSSEERERASWLIQKGADLSVRQGDPATGVMATHLAAGLMDVDLLMLMQERGADLLAKFTPKGGQTQVSTWDMLARRAHGRRQFSGDEDITDLVEGLTWLEQHGVAPGSSSLLSMRDEQVSMDQVIARINDVTLSESHIKRLKGKGFGTKVFEDCLSDVLFIGLRNNAFSLAKAAMDAGARTDRVLCVTMNQGEVKHETVESRVREIAAKDTFKKYTALDEAVAYNSALSARDAIDKMMSRQVIAQPAL
jgi:hypothetical protein